MAYPLIRRLAPLLLLLAGLPLCAQTSNVTAQITDSDGQPWSLGTCTIQGIYTAQVPAVAPYLNNGGAVALTPSCSVSGSGALTATVTDVAFIPAKFNMTWQFTVCPNVSQQAGRSACGVTQIPVTGANPSLTGQLNLPAPRIGGGVGAFAYSDIEVSPVYNNFYWNIISNTCRQYGTAWAQCASGGSTGTVNSGAAWQLTWYPGPGTGNTVGPTLNLWMLNPSASAATVNAFLATLTSGSDVVLIPPSFPQIAFSNPNYVEMLDMRPPAMTVQIGSAGIACDAQVLPGNITVTSGSNAIAFGGFAGIRVGQTVSMSYRSGYGYGATQETWLPTIVTYNSANGNATVSSNAPFAYTGRPIVGTDNTAAIQQIMTNVGSSYPIYLPTGCNIFTGTLAWNNSQSFLGPQMGSVNFYSKPGYDILQQPDSSTGGNANAVGLRLENLGFRMDSSVDPTLPITDYDASANPTTRALLYRPIHMAPEAQDANNPLGPGWITNGTNGVAAITAGSAVMCVPASETPPPVGQTVVFPYLTSVFSATVSSTAGSCSGGAVARTLSAALPTGSTSAQQEWFAGTAFQQSTVSIPANPTLPLTVNLLLPTAPVSGQSNFASHGHVKFGSSECDYMGNGSYGSQIVLRKCNTIPGYSSGVIFVPLNPAPAKNAFGGTDQPWPVTPTLNSGDSTPSGAAYFPGLNVGPAALSFPQANGNTWAGVGLGGAYLHNLNFYSTGGYGLSAATMYAAGNTASYGAHFADWNSEGFQYCIAQGPASAGQHGVAAVGPTGSDNVYDNITCRSGYPLTFVDMQNSSLTGMHLYGNEVSPYDGTAVGAGTCYFFGRSTDEQTGGTVTVTAYDTLASSPCEPELGSGAEVPVFAQLDQFFGTYNNDNVEGAFTIVGGVGNSFSASTSLHPPVIDAGTANHFYNLSGLTTQYATNTWPNGGFMEWGISGDCSYSAGGGNGPSVPCSNGLSQPASGRSIDASLAASRFENPDAAMIVPGEWNTLATLDAQPMTVSNVIDTTEPWVGRYAGCNLAPGAGNFCLPAHFDGFNGFIVVGTNGPRISDTSYDIVADFKTASASGQFNLVIGVEDPGTGSCSSPAQLASYTVTTTTSWPTAAWISPTPVNFSGHVGCAVTVGFSGATTTDQYRVGKFDFVSVPNQILLPTASPTVGSSCLGPNAIIGNNSSGPLSCYNGIVAQGAGSSPFQSLTTTGSNCAISSLAAGILNIPPCSPSGSSGFPFTLGGTTITAGGSFSSIAGLALTSSSINGVTPSTAGPNNQYLDKTGNYSIPAGSGTQTICSTTITLSGSLASGTQGSVGSGTCAGAQTSPQDVATCSTPTNIFTVAPFQPSTSGTPTLAIQVTTNTITINAANNLTTTQTFSGPTYTCRIFR